MYYIHLLLCWLGIHSWGKTYDVKTHHLGEFPWELWQHVCLRSFRTCKRCGVGKAVRSDTCRVVKKLTDQ